MAGSIDDVDPTHSAAAAAAAATAVSIGYRESKRCDFGGDGDASLSL